MYILAYILLILLTIPYALWGVYLLRRRIVFNEEFSAGLEGGTLAGVAAYLTLTILLLGLWTQQDTVLIIFAVLGLVVSAFALYGHIGISLSSRLLVDMFFDTRDRALDKPRFSAAEALVAMGDYESALQEYLIIARMYPKHPEVYVRIAETLLLMTRTQEAVRWFERALRNAKTAENSLPILYRLVNILEQDIGDREAAAELIDHYLHRYPNTPAKSALGERRAGLLITASTEKTALSSLERLKDHPLEQRQVDPAPLGAALYPKGRLRPQIEVNLDAEEDMEHADSAGDTPVSRAASSVLRSGVASIQAPLSTPDATGNDRDAGPTPQPESQVDALESHPLNSPTDAGGTSSGRRDEGDNDEDSADKAAW